MVLQLQSVIVVHLTLQLILGAVLDLGQNTLTQGHCLQVENHMGFRLVNLEGLSPYLLHRRRMFLHTLGAALALDHFTLTRLLRRPGAEMALHLAGQLVNKRRSQWKTSR